VVNITLDQFRKPSLIHEQLLIGYLWSSPVKYQKLRSHKFQNESFTNERWRYYFFLGKEMFDNGVRQYDDKTVYSYLMSKHKSKTNWVEEFEKYGGYDVLHELMNECTNDSQNEDYHLQEVQKYEVLRKFEAENLINLSDKVLIDKLCKMNLKQVQAYFQHKISTIFSNVNHGEVIEYNLLSEDLIDQVIEKMDAGEVMGLPLHNANRLNRKLKGWRKGTLSYLVLSSGVGKTSFGFEKYILSLIENQQKGLIFANEENVDKFIRLMLATVASRIINKPINRERMNMGNFDKDDTRAKLQEAKAWLVKNHPEMIKFFHLKKYRVEDMINRIEMYRPLGYEFVFIDTFKPDRGGGDAARWEKFSNNAQELLDAIKPDANNCGTLATVQLKIGKEYRYLDLSVIGKSGEIVEVADTVLAGRLMYDDEKPLKPGQPKPPKYRPIKAYNYENNKKVDYDLDPDKEYLIVFIAKNREGGKDEQILFEVVYGLNAWREVAYVQVPKEASSYF
jgi:replicative DNA helicase